jgi:hypothetical protein
MFAGLIPRFDARMTAKRSIKPAKMGGARAADRPARGVCTGVGMLVAEPGRREGVLSDGSEALSGFAAEQSVGLTRFAQLLSGDRQVAEDLVQDALLGMFRRFGDDLSVAAPLAYARRAIVNACPDPGDARRPRSSPPWCRTSPAVTGCRAGTGICGPPCPGCWTGSAWCW